MGLPSKQLNTRCKKKKKKTKKENIRSYIQAFIKWLKVVFGVVCKSKMQLLNSEEKSHCWWMFVLYILLVITCKYQFECFLSKQLTIVGVWHDIFVLLEKSKLPLLWLSVFHREASIIYFVKYEKHILMLQILPDASVITIFISENIKLKWVLSGFQSENSCNI